MRGLIDKIMFAGLGLSWRWGWYEMRRDAGHPISLWRAFFGKFPRFGAYEYNEVGCSKECKKDYETVVDARFL